MPAFIVASKYLDEGSGQVESKDGQEKRRAGTVVLVCGYWDICQISSNHWQRLESLWLWDHVSIRNSTQVAAYSPHKGHTFPSMGYTCHRGYPVPHTGYTFLHTLRTFPHTLNTSPPTLYTFSHTSSHNRWALDCMLPTCSRL